MLAVFSAKAANAPPCSRPKGCKCCSSTGIFILIYSAVTSTTSILSRSERLLLPNWFNWAMFTDSNGIKTGRLVSTKKTIYIIRHGQTDYNKKGIIQGSGVDSDLNLTGRKQALQFYEAYKHMSFQKIYTSELKRTVQSVAPFLEDGHRHEVMPELNEINWGIFEGLEATPDYHQIYLNMVQNWREGRLDQAVEGGETPLQMWERQMKAKAKLLERQMEDQVLICMHGRAMRSFLCLLTQQHLSEMDQFEHTNLCLYVLKQNGNYFDIVEANNTRHLEF